MENIKAVRLIRIRYILALTLIALLVTGSWIALQRATARYIELVEIAAQVSKQAELIQRITSAELLLQTTADSAAGDRLRDAVERLRLSQRQLRQKLQDLTLAADEAHSLQQLYAQPQSDDTGLLQRFLLDSRRLDPARLDAPRDSGIPAASRNLSLLQRLTDSFDTAQSELRQMRDKAASRLDTLEQQIWIATLMLLLLEALLFFRPLEKRVHSSIVDLQRMVSKLESKREKFAAARVKAESASEAKSQFLATMTHELRTPMNGVLGMSELLSGTTLDEQQREYVQIIVDSSESLLTIINDILDFSRLEAGKVTLEQLPFNLEQSVYDVMALLAPRCQNKTLQLILDYAPDLPRNFIGDPGRIRQIFFNLIGNAIKFTERGFVQVSISVDTGTDGKCGIAIHVEDSGIGIAPEKVESLFDSFTQADSSTTRKYGGTGLGLSITRELISLMGGHIALDSAPHKGSVFSLDLALPLAARIDELPVPVGDIKHVMLLEPNEIYRDLIIDRLSRIDIETAVVASASEIRARLRAIEKHGGAPQIVIVSQEAMLEPNNRWQAFSDGALQNPVSWLLLGNGDEESTRSRKRSRHLQGHTTFMQKPFTNYQLYYALDTCMRQQGRLNSAPQEEEDSTDFTLPQVSRGNILLVEDNLANQKFASLLLSKMGYGADIAENGRAAIELWRERAYDLILMDCLMPIMDGYAASRGIRELEAGQGRIPIIALTANASERDREKCREAGMDEILTKPYRKRELADLLGRWLSAEPGLLHIRHNLG